MSILTDINQSLNNLDSLSLQEVEKASLMRRKDQKYLFSVRQIPIILDAVKNDYKVLEIEKIREHGYTTMYYDTEDLKMYRKHHRGMMNRHKVRFRKYESTDLVFLEVKFKNCHGVTSKKRMPVSNGKNIILSKEEEFLMSYTPFSGESLQPVLENNFFRVTLVHNDQRERITIDYNLGFSGPDHLKHLDLPGVAIAEIKFQNRLTNSVFAKALRKNHIYPQRFSKYCTGLAMLNPDLKQNLFKNRIRKVNKINTNNFF